MTATALRFWLCTIAIIAVLSWLNIWLGIASTIIVIIVVFVVPGWLTRSGFRGS